MADLKETLLSLFTGPPLTAEELSDALSDSITEHVEKKIEPLVVNDDPRLLPDITPEQAAILEESIGENAQNPFVTADDQRLLPELTAEQAAVIAESVGANAQKPFVTTDDIRLKQELTEDQKAALAGSFGTPNAQNPFITNDDNRILLPEEVNAVQGTSGTPSAQNKFVTDSDPRNADKRNPLPHVHSSADLPSKFNTIIKPLTTSIDSSSLLSDDPHLLFPLAANGKYIFRTRIYFDTAATPDFKYQFTGPDSPQLVRILCRELVPGGIAESLRLDTSFNVLSSITSLLGTSGGYVQAEGIIHNGLNPGNFIFQWAQNTQNNALTSVLAGSFIEWAQI